jgi:flavin reductase (DIM6/NTAB) family NADH-FMN oxidoreductase RutF
MKMKISIGPATLLYPAPVLVIGTYDKDDQPNIMTASWGGICCSNPPCVAVSVREATYTHGNLKHHKAFTINIPTEDQLVQADYIGFTSGRNENKFDTLAYTPIKSEHVHAPIVKEFPFSHECKVLHITEIGSHTQFVGHIIDTKVHKDFIGENNNPDPLKIKPFAFDPGTRGYYSLGKRLANAFSAGKALKK